MLTFIRSSLPAAIALFLLSATCNSAQAQNIAANNIFTGTTVTTGSDSYGTGPASIVDGTTAYDAPGVDGNSSFPSTVSISGFNSSVDSISFYSGFPNALRYSPSVTIYYSLSLTASLNSTSYIPLAQEIDPITLSVTPLTLQIANSQYVNPTVGLTDPTWGTPLTYDTLTNLGIPVGTQSILFDFTKNGGYVPELNEIQGFAAVVPEPSTWALMLAGGAMLLVLNRSRSLKV